MTKLTRKVWVGIGAATIAGASDRGRRHGPAWRPQGAQAGAGTRGTPRRPPRIPPQGGEAYLTDGGPRDSRIRFYRDLA